MKKTLAPLLALSGTLIFAYLTRPRLSIPHLQALSKKTNQDKTNATFHYTPQGAFLLPSQTTVKIDSKTAAANAWHDAMAADVPRQMIEQEAYRPGSQDASIEDECTA